jgi:malonyl CoA-acyl carrier protein transacylase
MIRPARETALLFPTGGYHWPGMGADIAASPRRDVFARAEAAILPHGVPPGSLRRLMSGENQARRVRTPEGWSWDGDFPLSMVAQMALGVALAEAWIEHHGPPRLLAGESMGELAAYAVAGALPLEEAARLTHQWARDLQAASDRLSLRMAVIEDLSIEEVETLPAHLEARVVVTEAPGLCVVALPAAHLQDLGREVIRRGGHTLVSNNPCAAHEPRLAEARDIWSAHSGLLATLSFSPTKTTVLATLDPGATLETPADLRANREETSFRPVHWGETLRRLPDLGVRRAVIFGPSSAGYAFRKLRAGVPECAELRLATIGTLARTGGKVAGRHPPANRSGAPHARALEEGSS